MSVLPRELNYTESLKTLPNSTKNISCVISPINGTEFGSNDIIQFDMPSRGYLVPNSLVLRYRNTVVKTVETTTMLGTPVYTPFNRLETYCGAQIIESISDYNQVCNFVTNCKLNVAQKAGVASAFGYLDKVTSPASDNMNGCAVAIGTNVFDVAGPLNCVLSNATNLFPLGLAPACRIQLTVEALANMFQTTTNAVTSVLLSRMELCFDIVDFSDDVTAVVKSMSDANGNLIIKSQSYTTSTLNLPAGSSGGLELTYNQRISSIKSIFALFSAPAIGSKKFGAKDVTKGAGTYGFQIGSEQFPNRLLSAENKAGMFCELAQAWSNAQSIESTNMSIIPIEYHYIDGETDSGVIPAKFYVGVNTERLSTNQTIISGTSSQLSPISVRVNIPTTTTHQHNVTLVTVFDALIELNVITRQANIKS
jgi:hypothetical protein